MNNNSSIYIFRQISHYPDPLLEEGKGLVSQLENHGSIGKELLEITTKVLPLSRFLTSSLAKEPGLLEKLIQRGQLLSPMGMKDIYQVAASTIREAKDEKELMRRLRRFRNRQMFRIAWRDLTGMAHLEETLSELSNLADICIRLSLEWLYQDLEKQFGTPLYPDGRHQDLIVLAMGKLGARELNFSSDIDLIFAYPEPGHTSGGKRDISNEEFFLHLARRLIRSLAQHTEDGFVFRVDTRLRPFGDSGPLVLCADAAEEYYENYGRQWERYAMIKARAAAGDIEAGNELIKHLKPFVYRKYLDYSTIDSLRQMKAMILAEQDSKALEDDIKLGPGGIRDIEFICQTFQLLKGGRIPALQERYLLKALEQIERFSLLDSETANRLKQAYVFLRIVENRLQEYADQQEHHLPSNHDRRLRLSVATGFPSWAEFRTCLSRHMRHVHTIFTGLFSKAKKAMPQTRPHPRIKQGNSGDLPKRYLLAWEDPRAQEGFYFLKSLGFSSGISILASLRTSPKIQLLPGKTREILDKLMPRIIAACTKTSDPDKALSGSIRIIEAVLQRSIYLMLLVEYPQALLHLVHLCSKSRWIADLLSRQPILLDELIDAENLFMPLSRKELQDQVSALTQSMDENDLELFMDELRRLKKGKVLKVAACDLDNLVDVIQTGVMLTSLARVLLENCFTNALAYMTEREPGFYHKPVTVNDCGMAVIAYGKMGGREMGYASDLDLVFLYDPLASTIRQDDDTGGSTYFFSRLVQRLIFLLTTRTSQGVLYEIDTRLRPNGSQGILVSNIRGFKEYQTNKAWTWEHQALIRARFVAGDKNTGLLFERTRKDVLRTKRSRRRLAKEVLDMRGKIMRSARGRDGQAPFFHLKKDPGGMVDIEFLVQYLVLLHAVRHRELTFFTGCIDLLKVLGRLHLLSPDQTDVLISSYNLYRKNVNHLTLDLKGPKVSGDSFQEQRHMVSRIFQDILETN